MMRWSAKEDALLREAVALREPVAELVWLLDRTPAEIAARASELSLRYRPPWTSGEDRTLRRLWQQGVPALEIAERLGRTPKAVASRVKVLGCRRPVDRHRWSEAERELLRRVYGTMPAAQIADQMGLSTSQVYRQAAKLSLTEDKVMPAKFRELIRRLHSKGWHDREIAAEWNRLHPDLTCRRETVKDHRLALGLASNANNERHRRRVAAKTREQCRQAGVNSLAEIRRRAYAKFAAENGWPSDLPPRAVQILNVLYEHGPQTRRQLAAAIGMPWKGSRASLTAAAHPGGSYLALLQRRGLVVNLGRKVVGGQKSKNGTGQGKNVCLYAIPLQVRRQSDERQEALAGS